jgi:hypothetical protein
MVKGYLTGGMGIPQTSVDKPVENWVGGPLKASKTEEFYHFAQFSVSAEPVEKCATADPQTGRPAGRIPRRRR